MKMGDRITRLRKDKGISQAQLAQLARIPLSTVNYVERGIRDGEGLSVATAKRLAKALSVTLDQLTGMYDEESESLTAVAS